MRDKEFFERVDVIKNRLYKIAYSYMGNESIAVDAVDEAIYKGYVKKHQLKKEEFFETWLTRILINICNNLCKKKGKEVDLELLSEASVQEEFDQMSLKFAIESLPTNMKEIIILHFFGGYTVVETAKILEIPQGTVATRLRKSLSLLRLEMEVE